MAPGQPSAASASSGGIFVVVGLGVLAVVWSGAQLAALLHGERLSAGVGPTVEALVRLPANASDPRLAWGPPQQSALPAAALYWAATTFAAALGAVAVAFGLRIFGRGPIGTEKRNRLGVDTKARLATARDLAPLIVKGPTPGRLVLGRVNGRLVASELRDPTRPAKPGSRAGDRSAVAVIGPSRCGKSANIISAILENWPRSCCGRCCSPPRCRGRRWATSCAGCWPTTPASPTSPTASTLPCRASIRSGGVTPPWPC